MKLRNIIYPVLIAALMVFIFCMSAENADDSTDTSTGFCAVAADLFIDNLSDFTPSVQEQIIDGFSFAVRKAAHFSEYALLGCLWYLWLHKKRYSPLIALGASALYAVTDEFHQSFVPGRSCELRDMLVDSSGALTGIAFAFVLLCVIRCIKTKPWKQDT